MKLYELIVEDAPPEGYAKVLRNAREIAEYIEGIASDEVDTEFIEEHYFGCRARLMHLSVSELREGPAAANMADEDKEAEYSRMPAETMPPLVVEDGEIADGNHRFRVVVKRGDTRVWCYVVEEK